jgi:hypothetical protein
VKVETKSAVVLLVTLVLGLILGALATGAAARQRVDELTRLRRPPGFAAHMREVIQPHSDAQWDSLRPIVEATGRRNDEIRRNMQRELRAELDSMQLRLRPLLNGEQRERLEDFARRPPPPGGPGMGPRGGRPPPPRGQRPPPPEDFGPPQPRDGEGPP